MTQAHVRKTIEELTLLEENRHTHEYEQEITSTSAGTNF